MEKGTSWGVTGLILTMTSMITAAILPNNKEKRAAGKLLVTNNGAVANQLTCSRDQATGAACSWSITRPGGIRSMPALIQGLQHMEK
ncbi:MAG: hypothetical protein J7621_21910 [Niastella sp.]|nr:hypothetical protein [Niastella sp.]